MQQIFMIFFPDQITEKEWTYFATIKCKQKFKIFFVIKNFVAFNIF